MPNSIRYSLVVAACLAANLGLADGLRGSWNTTLVRPDVPLPFVTTMGMVGDRLFASDDITNSIQCWTDRWTGIGSANGTIQTMVAWDGGLLVGGDFTTVGGAACRRLAYWDGSAWSEFGGGVAEGRIEALVVAGGVLYVGGVFAEIGGVPAHNIAAWSGATWSALDDGVPHEVTALGVRRGLVVVGQSSTTEVPVAGVALLAWDGTAWSQPFPALPSWVDAMAMDDDILAVGGDHDDGRLFVLAGDSWQETTLDMPEWGWSAYCSALAIQDGDVYVSWSWYGYFSGGWYLKVWNGSALVDLPAEQSPDDHVATMLAGPDGIIFGGTFNHVGSTIAMKVAALSSGGGVRTFHRQGAGFSGTPSKISASGDQVFVGGVPLGSTAWTDLGVIGGWSGHDWFRPECGYELVADTWLADLEVYPGHQGWAVTWGQYGGGPPSYHSSVCLDGERAGRSEVAAIVYHDGSWTRAFVDRDADSYFAGTELSSPPGYFEGGSVDEIMVCSFGVAVCGSFTTCNGLARRCVTVWDGSQWADLAGGLDGQVRDVIEWNGLLLAAGRFTIVPSGQPAMVAAWDGSAWTPLLTGADDEVTSVVEHQGRLFAAGPFTHVDERSVRRIAILDDDGTWRAFGGGANGTVTALASSTHGLWLIGDFTEVGGVESSRVALWEGTCVAVEVSGFAAAWAGSEATIGWTLSEPLGMGGALRLERERGGASQILHEFTGPAGERAFRITDAAGIPGDHYRLYRLDGGAAPQLIADATLGPRPAAASGLQLAAPAPNPANPATAIAYTTAEAGRVIVAIYDLRGRRLRVIVDDVMAGGPHETVWDGRDAAGRAMPSGTYCVRLSAGGEVRSVKVGLVR